MKQMLRLFSIIVLAMFIVTAAGCYGSFTLTKKVYDFNGSFGNKFVNSAVMWLLHFVPVYEGAAFIDVAILNTLEFWTGSNPLAMAPNEKKIKYATSEGKTYELILTKNNIRITEIAGPDTGKTILLSYSPHTKNWTMDDGKQVVTVAKMKGDLMNLITPDGKNLQVQIR